MEKVIPISRKTIVEITSGTQQLLSRKELVELSQDRNRWKKVTRMVDAIKYDGDKRRR